jgi:hypothetical protein
VTEPIIGSGPNGEPQTARQAFLNVLDEAKREWKLQEDLPDDELTRLEKDLGIRGAHDYLRARLDGGLKTLYMLALRLPKEIFTMPLPDNSNQSE